MKQGSGYQVDVSKLKAKMIGSGYTVATLAHKAGVSRATIARLVSGHPPTYRTIITVAAELQMHPAESSDIFLRETYALRKFKITYIVY